MNVVDHEIMKKKLKYYMTEGNFMRLINSFLKDRYQYAEIHTMKSRMIKSLNCSVIQGSKMSRLL